MAIESRNEVRTNEVGITTETTTDEAAPEEYAWDVYLMVIQVKPNNSSRETWPRKKITTSTHRSNGGAAAKGNARKLIDTQMKKFIKHLIKESSEN